MGSRKAEQAEEGGRDTPSGRQGGGSVMSLEPVPFACGQPGRGSLVSSGATDRRKTLLVCMYASGGGGGEAGPGRVRWWAGRLSREAYRIDMPAGVPGQCLGRLERRAVQQQGARCTGAVYDWGKLECMERLFGRLGSAGNERMQSLGARMNAGGMQSQGNYSFFPRIDSGIP